MCVLSLTYRLCNIFLGGRGASPLSACLKALAANYLAGSLHSFHDFSPCAKTHSFNGPENLYRPDGVCSNYFSSEINIQPHTYVIRSIFRPSAVVVSVTLFYFGTCIFLSALLGKCSLSSLDAFAVHHFHS